MCANVTKQKYQNDIMPGYTGNIDLTNRPQVPDGKGNTMTVLSMSFNDGKKEVLVPRIRDDGKVMSEDEAIQHYFKTGKHLGKFDTPEEATKFAQALHEQQEKMYLKRK